MFPNKRWLLIAANELKGKNNISSPLVTRQLLEQTRLLSSGATQSQISSFRLTESTSNVNQICEEPQPFKAMPSISSLSMTRHFLPGGKYFKLDPTQLMLNLKKDLGPICRANGYMGQPPQVITHTPSDFEKVFRNEGVWPIRPGFQASDYHRHVHRADFFQGVEGVIATHGEQWANFRSIVNPVLLQPKTVRLYYHKMSEVIKEFIERIREIRDPLTLEVPATFEDELNRWTLESVSVIALDKKLGLISKNRNNPDVKRIFKLLNDFFTIGATLEFGLPLWKYYKTKKFKNHMKTLDELTEIGSKYVQEAIERLEMDQRNGVPEKPDREKSVLEKLIKIDKKIATVMAMDMLMAGVDTTSTTFVGLLLCLAKNPEKQSKLRAEIMTILAHKDSDVDEDAFRNMPYLRACIKEALRIYPLSLGNSRILANDTILSGYHVSKGTQVTMISSSLLQDDAHYPRAKEFLPERWLRSSKDSRNASACEGSLKASSPFIYLPFGFGPRSCVGRRIVEMELEMGIAQLVRNFYIDYKYPTENAFKTLMINVPNIPLKFQFTDVEN